MKIEKRQHEYVYEIEVQYNGNLSSKVVFAPIKLKTNILSGPDGRGDTQAVSGEEQGWCLYEHPFFPLYWLFSLLSPAPLNVTSSSLQADVC